MRRELGDKERPLPREQVATREGKAEDLRRKGGYVAERTVELGQLGNRALRAVARSWGAHTASSRQTMIADIISSEWEDMRA